MPKPTAPVVNDDTDRDAKRVVATVGDGVMSALGRPGDLFRVVAVKLWGDNYRVNVLTGADPTSIRIAHSFFVTADAKGGVVASEPAITRQY